MSSRSASVTSWVLFVLGTLACLIVAYGAYTLAGYSWNQVVEYQSPYVRPFAGSADELTSSAAFVPSVLEQKSPASGPALSPRVVLVIVDGMRDDVSRTAMPSLQTLRNYGSDFVLTVPQPSLSYPNWTTILTGAPQTISGVTTNWYEGKVTPLTIMDSASKAGRRVAVAGPEDFAELYGVRDGPTVSLRPWPKGRYLTSRLVDDALRISKESTPALLVLHLPDLDEAGHAHGGASAEYRDVARKIDADIGRLVSGLQGDSTTFVITADHGHTDTGGHGGWEDEAVRVPAIITGNAATLSSGTGTLEQIAPTIAVLVGVPVPASATGTALRSALKTSSPGVFAAQAEHHRRSAAWQVEVVTGGNLPGAIWLRDVVRSGDVDAAAEKVVAERLAVERGQRVPVSLAILGAALALVVALGVASWRALICAGAGTVTYYVLYNGLFFLTHGYLWSLSAFNTETRVQAFMNGRMIEAVLSALIAVLVAGGVYPLLRRMPRASSEHRYLSGWLAMAPATVLLIQATLAVQVAWYLWWWGAEISWILPDFKWAFKADLDMLQMTALGAAALIAPLVTYTVGRYHPKVYGRRATGVTGRRS